MSDTIQKRRGEVERATSETEVTVKLGLDGTGECRIDTSVPFLDHMLRLFGAHGFFDLEISARGDIEIDDHHTVEDVGICLGQAFAAALGNKAGIRRYGSCCLPMDEALVRVVLDFSNRAYLHYQVELPDQKVGRFDTCLAREFLQALTLHAGLTLHVDLLRGRNSHHIIEAVFKALGRAVDEATAVMPGRAEAVMSTKGCL